MEGRKPQLENNEGPNLEERKRIPVRLTEHLLRAGETVVLLVGGGV